MHVLNLTARQGRARVATTQAPTPISNVVVDRQNKLRFPHDRYQLF
jgi:hypothetical protein